MIPNVVVYLLEPVFSHGQLYVALSRATTRLNVKKLVIPVTDEKMKKGGEKEVYNKWCNIHKEYRL
jgi:ATP-dependent DNA helicase PIF1